MPSLFDTVNEQLGGANLAQISQHIGADEATTQQAIQAALPMLIGGLARNASNPDGAAALSNALSNHADGSALGGLGGLLGGGAGAWRGAASQVLPRSSGPRSATSKAKGGLKDAL